MIDDNISSLALNVKTKELWESTRPWSTTRNRISVKNWDTGKWYQYATSSLRFLSYAEVQTVFQAKKILRAKKKRSEADYQVLKEYQNLFA